MHLLQKADLGISDVKATNKKIPYNIDQLSDLKNQLPPSVYSEIEKDKSFNYLDIQVSHQTANNKSVQLNFEKEESAGTRRYFSLIGYWLEMLYNGYTVFIDEIETSLHPLLVKEILNTLFSITKNKKYFQLVFTTHNALLLDLDIMRRDQIWFTEKNNAGATNLYPLTDYRPRKDERLIRGYLAGRYGGIPFIPEGLKP